MASRKVRKSIKFFNAKNFSFVIAFLVFGVFCALYFGTKILQNIESSVLDLHFRLKVGPEVSSEQVGTSTTEANQKISDDIMILGIEQKALAEYGRWPFSRSKHADLINSFSRVKDQSNRESALFLDIFFIEPDGDPTNDALLVDAIDKSGTVFLETILQGYGSNYVGDEFVDRQQVIIDKTGDIKNVQGKWADIPVFYGLEPPLEAYGKAIKGYGHANFLPDDDQVYRRQPLILREGILVNEYRLDELTTSFTVDSSNFERLSWQDKKGNYHDIAFPLTESSLKELNTKMAQNAPICIEDYDLDGVPDDSYYVVGHYKDNIIPAITLSLALNYFHKTVDDIEIVLGSHILIPNPMVVSDESDELVSYTIQYTPDEYDAEGVLISSGKVRELPEIRIPINDKGQMLVNFMGYRSSSSVEGIQTFPVRPYVNYAQRAPSNDPSSWRRSWPVKNKILMVGAFASGVADDEKPTPLGIMYGIEIHANALNTILMDNFIIQAPEWQNILAIGIAVFLIAFLSARIPAVASFFITLLGIGGYFFVVNYFFDSSSYVLDFAGPALAAIMSFVLVVVYRVFTEENDKKAIRETFGKYLSPKVVEELAINPPELGGVDKELTVFFSDIRGFTSLSETMTPQELVNHLNIYLTAMTDLAIEYSGTLDKYIGDAVMCFWGAPLPLQNHAELACKCALKQMQVLAKLNENWPEERRLRIGIGINSGIVTVGNMGSKQRMNYTLMGDHVNLGSRLEATNKEYGTGIIISEYTYALVKDKFVVRELDNIRVKGKNKPVLIYELVDCLESLEPNANVIGAAKK